MIKIDIKCPKINKILESLFKLVKVITPSEWAETNRIMTTDVSNFPGRYSFSKTPYFKEIADCASDTVPVSQIAFMKGAQIGASTGIIENIIGWIIGVSPCNTLFASGDKELSKEAFETKIDNMIANSGLSEKLRPNVKKKRNSKTGDTSTKKEFFGGSVVARSVQNAKKWKQTSFKIGFIDDFDAAYGADKKEGDLRSLIVQRFASYADSCKIFYISTPAIKQTSNIEPAYLMGDQRRWMVPCPCCGDFIPIEWRIKGVDDEWCGIRYDVDDDGELVDGSVRYVCQSCAGEFTEKGKGKLLRAGHWVPTAKPKEPGFRSYHLSALYAAPGMFDWTHYVRQWIRCNKSGNVEELQTFNNLVLGHTWEEQGQVPKSTKISQNIRQYEVGEVPCEMSVVDGNGEIVIITCACDLNGTIDDARLDWEICAHSESGSTYSIDQGSIGTFKRRRKEEDYGRDIRSYSQSKSNSVWTDFDEVINRRFPTDRGGEMFIHMTGVDVGYHTDEAYKFIDGRNRICALKGDDKEGSKPNFDSFTFKQSQSRSNLYLVKTIKVKDRLSGFMALDWDGDIDQPQNFMNFPIPSNNKYTVPGYFIEFEGEKRVVKFSSTGNPMSVVWEKKNSTSPNHFWDCRVYNLVLADAVSYFVCKSGKQKFPTWRIFCRMVLGDNAKF